MSLPSHLCTGQSEGSGCGSRSGPEYEGLLLEHLERLSDSLWRSREQAPTFDSYPQTSLSRRLGDEDPTETTSTGSAPQCPKKRCPNMNTIVINISGTQCFFVTTDLIRFLNL